MWDLKTQGRFNKTQMKPIRAEQTIQNEKNKGRRCKARHTKGEGFKVKQDPRKK